MQLRPWDYRSACQTPLSCGPIPAADMSPMEIGEVDVPWLLSKQCHVTEVKDSESLGCVSHKQYLLPLRLWNLPHVTVVAECLFQFEQSPACALGDP